jgi:ubiquinol-cytochrome c reductase cytochrome b subunit
MKPPLSRRIYHWVNDRFPWTRFMNWSLHEEIPGGTRFSYTLGSACLFLLIIQILTGIWQMFYYVPTVDHAYASLNYLRLEVPFGWLIHGLHYWGANAFTVVVGLHVIRVFIWGAYKKPRELVWLAGVILLLMTVGFMFTGPILPWDKKGYWAGQVGLSIAGNVPWIGPFIQSLLQGANKLGQLALMRLFVIHVAIIPFLTLMFVAIHLIAFRKFGSVGPWKEEKRKKSGEFWPEQLFKDALVAWFLFILLVGLSAFLPAPVSGAADPMDTLYTPKPEWNFLFLYQVLKYFQGPWEPLGTVGLPLLIILLFLSLPFIDRSPERNPSKRLFVMFCAGTFVLFVLGMTFVGDWSNPPMAEQAQYQNQAPSSENVKPPPIEEVQTKPLAKLSGEQLFKSLGCTTCHSATGRPSGRQGPDLIMALSQRQNLSADWLRVQLVSPQKHNPHTIMPPYGNLNSQKLNALIEYLHKLSLQKPETLSSEVKGVSKQAQDQENGEQLFNTIGCASCHTITGKTSNKQGPDLVMALAKKKQTKEWLKTQLLSPQQHNPSSVMPSYSQLGDQKITALVNFLDKLSANKPSAGNQKENEEAEDTSVEEEQPKENNGLGESIHIIGDKEHGAVLFQQSCIMCHGPKGKTTAPNFMAPKGVPTLNHIRRELISSKSDEFVRNIDNFIQHGMVNPIGGPNMPAFGDSHSLTQAQIADIEAYVLSLNAVDRAKIIHPGIEPKEFFYILLETSLLIFILCGIYWWMGRVFLQ